MLSLILAAALAFSAPATTAPDILPPPERRQDLLFDAARLGRSEMIAPLVKAGVGIDEYDARGFTPLIIAAYNDQMETLEALIAAGADPCKADGNQGNTALMGAAFRGNDAIAVRLLKTGCDVNARNHAGQTALMIAALFGREGHVEMLLTAGADPSLEDMAGRSARSVALAQGHEVLVAKLDTLPRH